MRFWTLIIVNQKYYIISIYKENMIKLKIF